MWSGPLQLLIGILALICILVVGRVLLMPLAIAVLLWNLLDTVIHTLSGLRWQRWRIPRALATLISMAVVALGVLIVVRILSSQVDAIAREWPRYVTRLENILADAVAYMGEDVAQQFLSALRSLDLTATVSSVLGSAGSMLISFFLVITYVLFLMVERSHLPDKMVALLPDYQRRREVQRIILLISASLRRYLWVKTVMSIFTGLASYIILRGFSVDFAETWALIIFLLNYIPNIGSILGVVFPSLLALVQFESLFSVLVLSLSLGSVQVLIGNVLEPMFMGRTLNLSSFVIILSLTFWGAVWGVVGMFISVPMTVMVMIICAHVPQWRPFAVLLSENGQLGPHHGRRNLTS